MAELPPSSQEVHIRVNSKRTTSNSNNNTVHPVEIAPPAPSPAPGASGSFIEVKHYKKWFPWLIPLFVVANIVVFVITMYVNNCPKNSASCIATFLGRFSFQPFKENPLLGPSSLTVVHRHQGWRLITCMWLHGGVFHLLANMLGILIIGIRLEQEFGFVLIGLLFVISGFGGSLLSALFIQSNISVGASGALFGLLGGMLSELITNWSIYDNKLAALFTLVIIIVVNLAVGILPHVDNFAHIGGFLTGFLLGFVFLIRPQFGWVHQRYAPIHYSPGRTKTKFKKYQCVLWVLSLVILIVGLSVGLVALLRGVDANNHCSWCHYLSCVPTSKWSCNTKAASCSTSQLGNQLNVTCSSNGNTDTYYMQNPTDSKIQQLCTQLCS
ncbi:Retinoblastoma-like protein 1 [Stylosanthes scabra]|uniref:RHOMBOID-like protein n=1 Tax=Stylosanthes scabra TaxID=79078 RepID=A0ABU6VGR9_9FABA|nr:Retinoblastoma-like protein 1 [Stylosanthes scabra]